MPVDVSVSLQLKVLRPMESRVRIGDLPETIHAGRPTDLSQRYSQIPSPVVRALVNV